MSKILGIVFLLIGLLVAVTVYSGHTPKDVGDGWQVAEPEAVGVDLKQLYRLRREIQQDHPGVDSVLVVRNGKLVYEYYFNRTHRNQVHNLASVGKSIASATLGIALQRGKVQSVDQSIYDFMPYQDYKNWDEAKAAITIKNLLTMRAGWDCGNVDDLESNCGRPMQRQEDPYKWVLDLPMAAEPGTRFNYNDAAPTFIQIIVSQAEARELNEYTMEHLFTPMGITHGLVDGGLTPREMAKFGQLFLQKGRWGDQQLVSEAWVEASTSVQVPFRTPSAFAKGYGYYWWVTDLSSGDTVYPSFMAVGNGGQYIIVVPDLELVLVFTGQNYNNFEQSSRVIGLVNDIVLPAVSTES